MCGTHARVFLLLLNDSKPCRNTVGSKRSLSHDQRNPNITCNIKGRLKNNFQTTFLYQKQPALSKIEVQAAFDKN